MDRRFNLKLTLEVSSDQDTKFGYTAITESKNLSHDSILAMEKNILDLLEQWRRQS